MNERTMRVLEYPKIIEMLAELAVSAQGRELCRGIHPSASLTVVGQLLSQTEEAENILFRSGSSPVQPFDDIRPSIARAKVSSVLSMGELLKIARFLRTVRVARSGIIGDDEDGDGLLLRYARSLQPNRSLEEEINRCILSEDEMQDEASPQLASIRRQIKGCHERIKEKLQSLLRSLEQGKVLQDSLITVRNDRYVLPVLAAHRQSVPGIVHDQSATGATLFIEPMAVVEINNQLRELVLKEREEIERILEEFSAQVTDFAEALTIDTQVMSQLDFIFARARLSRGMKAVMPKLNETGFISIKAGRHPLLDAKKAVPITVWLGREFTQLLITGPNTGGKTVTLKTIGLFALMTQSGLFIPADFGSEMPVFSQIFADIGDEQSIEQSLSTFSSHMKNIAEIMKTVTEDSLVLLDELGAGTDPTEGAALGMAILEGLRQRKIRTVVTTHYSELKAYSLSSEGTENASVEFDVVTLSPTYKLLVGVPGSSNAFLISRRLGLEDYLIDRARGYISEESMRLEDVLHQAESYRKTAENERKETQQLRQQTEELKKSAEQLQLSLEKQKEQFLNKAREEAQDVVEKARAQAEKIIEEMKELQRQGAEGAQLFEARARRKELEQLAAQKESSRQKNTAAMEKVDTLKPGDSVFIQSIGQVGAVLTLPNAKNELKVQVGILQMDVQLSDLAKAPEEKKENGGRSGIKISREAKNIPLSLDVRGQTGDEAIMNIDLYLDEALFAHYNEVTIIHGKGTGALRAAVTEFLRRRPHIKSFRPGRYGEGEQGVTVVELQ